MNESNAIVSAEVLQVIEHLPKQEKALIPKHIMENLERQSNGAKVKLKYDGMRNVILTDEAKAMLTVIFRNYFLNETGKLVLNKALIKNEIKKEEQKKKAHEKLNDPFYNTKERTISKEKIEVKEEKTEMVPYKENIWTRIKNIFLKLFKGGKNV